MPCKHIIEAFNSLIILISESLIHYLSYKWESKKQCVTKISKKREKHPTCFLAWDNQVGRHLRSDWTKGEKRTQSCTWPVLENKKEREVIMTWCMVPENFNPCIKLSTWSSTFTFLDERGGSAVIDLVLCLAWRIHFLTMAVLLIYYLQEFNDAKTITIILLDNLTKTENFQSSFYSNF